MKTALTWRPPAAAKRSVRGSDPTSGGKDLGCLSACLEPKTPEVFVSRLVGSLLSQIAARRSRARQVSGCQENPPLTCRVFSMSSMSSMVIPLGTQCSVIRLTAFTSPRASF
jgi:hypothetical protein